MSTEASLPSDSEVFAALTRALLQVSIRLPYLSGLARTVRIKVDSRVATIGVFPSGRILASPAFVAGLATDELVFVMAHELLHLALRTADRAERKDHYVFNVAHDYIINDMLAKELGRRVPAGGLTMEGASNLSLEHLAASLRGQTDLPTTCWKRKAPRPPSILGRALQQAGLVGTQGAEEVEQAGDVLSRDEERQWFPDVDLGELERQRLAIQRKAAEVNSLRAMIEVVERSVDRQRGTDPGSMTTVVSALRYSYRPPWELAVQHWLDLVAPGPRTYSRPSRRAGDRTDVVLPGRRREGWTLHIVLDTSGSMTSELPAMLGVIAAFCEASDVNDIHILQCDAAVAEEEWVRPEELEEYKVSGFGGSDMSPAMLRLAEDPEVTAAIVLTDGFIEYPQDTVPYHVLWVLCNASQSGYFRPGYGTVIWRDYQPS